MAKGDWALGECQVMLRRWESALKVESGAGRVPLKLNLAPGFWFRWSLYTY